MFDFSRKCWLRFTLPVFLLVGVFWISGCQSKKPGITPIDLILGTDTPEATPVTVPDILSSETTTPEAIFFPPVILDGETPQPEPSPTDSYTATPAPTDTPVPPVVANPVPPEFPMMGIEITNIRDVEKVAQSGAYWVRTNSFIWSVVEPAEGNRDWGSVATLERELVTIAAYNMQTILIVRGTPSWAQKIPGIHCAPMSAEKIEAFASFMYDAVSRYSQPPYNVRYWELGNEPDVDPALVSTDSPYGCWGDPSDPYYGGGYYAEMLKAVYPAIKRADPQAQVLVGGLLLLCDPDNPPDVKGQPGVKADCSPARFLEGVLVNGGGDYFDGVSFHAYDYYLGVPGKYGNGSWHSSGKTTGPVLIAKTLFLRNLLARYGYTDKYLMNTENAVLCGVTGKEAPCSTEDWTDTKAHHLVEAFTAAATLGLRANIWYCLTGWRASGLVDIYGQPVPAYQALYFNDTMLRGATPMGEISLYQGVKGFAFQKEGRLLWVLWSLDGQDHSIPLGSLPFVVNDAFGGSLAPSENITITLSPVYIVW